MKKPVMPNPNEPFSLDGGKTINPVWYQYLADMTRALNSLL